MSGELMLEATQTSLLIIETRGQRDIVIGVPHHAPAGVDRLPCGRPADENTGFLGRHLAERLDVCSVIACNYLVDVNKYFRSDYSMQIAEWDPMVLVEIHGHRKGKPANSYIEVSSGAVNNDRSKALAGALREKLKAIKEFDSWNACGQYADLVCGDYPKLGLQAKDAVTVNDGRWLAYHIELPPAVRIPSGSGKGKPPDLGYQFCAALAEVLCELHRKRNC